jgi:hypothetical protein
MSIVDTAQAKADHKKNDGDAASLREEAERKKQQRAKQARLESKFLSFRSYLMLLWILSNCLLASLITNYSVTVDFLTVLLYMIIFFNGTRLIGSLIYITTFAFTRRKEQLLAAEARRNSALLAGSDPNQIKAHPWWSYPAEIVLIFFRPKTYAAIFMEMIISPVLLLLSAAWIALTGAFCAVSICDQRIAIFSFKSWRSLAKLEFNLFSSDGTVAKALKIDSISRNHAPRVCMEGSLPPSAKVTVSFLAFASPH